MFYGSFLVSLYLYISMGRTVCIYLSFSCCVEPFKYALMPSHWSHGSVHFGCWVFNHLFGLPCKCCQNWWSDVPWITCWVQHTMSNINVCISMYIILPIEFIIPPFAKHTYLKEHFGRNILCSFVTKEKAKQTQIV